MSTIHDHNRSRRRRVRRVAAVLVIGVGPMLAAADAGAGNAATCYPLAADIGSIAGPMTVLPAETIEAMTAPVVCSSGGSATPAWPVEADVGSIGA